MSTAAPRFVPRALRPGPLALATIVTLLGGCNATVPQLPEAPEADRRPVNSAAAIELQTCRAEVSALRLGLLEARQGSPRAAQCTAPTTDVPEPPTASRRVVLTFERGQSRVELDEALRDALREASVGAELILVQGRSDAAQESAAETQLARRRAEAAAAALVHAGLPASRLRLSWLGVADPNSESDHRRRVDLDFIPRAPVLVMARAAVPPAGLGTSAEATRSASGKEPVVPAALQQPGQLPSSTPVSSVAQTASQPTQRALLKR